jgi:hypothetical protein
VITRESRRQVQGKRTSEWGKWLIRLMVAQVASPRLAQVP